MRNGRIEDWEAVGICNLRAVVRIDRIFEVPMEHAWLSVDAWRASRKLDCRFVLRE